MLFEKAEVTHILACFSLTQFVGPSDPGFVL